MSSALVMPRPPCASTRLIRDDGHKHLVRMVMEQGARLTRVWSRYRCARRNGPRSSDHGRPPTLWVRQIRGPWLRDAGAGCLRRAGELASGSASVAARPLGRAPHRISEGYGRDRPVRTGGSEGGMARRGSGEGAARDSDVFSGQETARAHLAGHESALVDGDVAAVPAAQAGQSDAVELVRREQAPRSGGICARLRLFRRVL